MRMRKKLIFIVTLFISGLFFGVGKTEQIQAAAKFTSVPLNGLHEEATVGKLKFQLKITGSFFSGTTSEKLYVTKNKKKFLIDSADGQKVKLIGGILTNGTTVYYSKTFYTKSADGRTVPKNCCIYKVKIGKGKSKKVCSIKSRSASRESLLESLVILGIWKNKLYYFGHWEDTIYSYSMASHKHEEVGGVINKESGKQYKNHIYVRNGYQSCKDVLYEINAKNGEVNTISEYVMLGKEGCRYDIVTGKIYFLELLDQDWLHKSSYDPYGGNYDHVALKRCNLDGSGTVTLIEDFAVGYAKPVVFKKNSITYYNEHGKKRTKKFS